MQFESSEADSRAHYLLSSLLSVLVGAAALVFLVVLMTDVSRGLATSVVLGYAVFAFIAAGSVALSVHSTRRIALLVLLMGQVFWFAWPALRVVTSGTDWFGDGVNYYLKDEEVVLTAFYLTLFGLLSLITYAVTTHRLTRRETAGASGKDEATDFSSRALTITALGLTALGLLPFIFYGGSVQNIIQGVMGSRGAGMDKSWAQTAFESQPLYVIGRATLVTAGALALLQVLKLRRFKLRLAWGLLFVFSFMITYFDSGTRSWTALILLPPALEYFRESLSKRKLMRWLLLGPAVLLAVFWVAQLQLNFRNTGFSTDALSSENNFQIWDNDFFSETAVAVSLVPAQMDYLHESTLVLYLTNPIPRAIWEEKPYPRVIEMYSLGRRGYNEYRDRGSSSMPSVVGQFYMSWGWFGVVEIALVYGLFMAWLDALWRRQGSSELTHIWAATAIVWLFLSYRGLFPGFHYPVLILGLLVLLEKRWSGRRARSKARASSPPVAMRWAGYGRQS
ncbi:MAG TPA: O-antigen polymerase [Blastocatellia bacterium]|nr:O-antigen polymerase [Blastocatellia bacterium]